MITICCHCHKTKKCDFILMRMQDTGLLGKKDEEEKYRMCEDCKCNIVK